MGSENKALIFHFSKKKKKKKRKEKKKNPKKIYSHDQKGLNFF